jgi:tetratricopeptide (TPR) repeat protein
VTDERERLEELVARFLERRERGEPIDAATFLREHAEDADALRPLLDAVGDVERRFDAVAATRSDQIGPYRVAGELGRGASGSVLGAVDAQGRELAVKVLRGSNALSTRARERFEREAERLRTLRHPHVVRIVDADTGCAEPWIAMERVAGRSLAAEIAEARAAGAAPIAPERAARLALELASGVAAVHEAGLLHRDIKPANVLLDAADHVVLVDFGLVHDDEARTLTRTGDLIGTPQYMAPEQARGERADPRTDVWGIGAVLYELLTLRPPHGTGDPLSVLERARTRAVPRPGRVARGVPADLERIVVRALSPGRGRRTASARDLVRDLEAFLAGDPVLAAPTSTLERAENVWRFHKLRVLAGLACVLAFAAALPIVEHRIARKRAAAVAQVEHAAAAWAGGDARERAAAAEELARADPDGPWAAFVLALLEEKPPPASADPAVQSAANGRAASAAKRHDDAVAAYRTAKELAPGSIVPIVLLADAADDARQRDLAVRELRAAVERLPDSAPLHARLSAFHYSAKEDAEAERAIRTAIELAPHAGRHHFQLGRVLGRLGRSEEALAAALRGAELSGEHTSVFELQILATMLSGAERHAEARAMLERVLAREPEQPRALYNLAFSYMLDHHYAEARATCERLIAHGAPGRGHAALAWLYAGSNRTRCEACRAYYEAHPEELDFARAEEHALRSLERVEADEIVPLVAQIARTIDRRDAVRERLTRLKDASDNDQRIALYERALRQLRD